MVLGAENVCAPCKASSRQFAPVYISPAQHQFLLHPSVSFSFVLRLPNSIRISLPYKVTGGSHKHPSFDFVLDTSIHQERPFLARTPFTASTNMYSPTPALRNVCSENLTWCGCVIRVSGPKVEPIGETGHRSSHDARHHLFTHTFALPRPALPCSWHFLTIFDSRMTRNLLPK